MENTIGKEFIEKTKYQYLEESMQSKGVPWPDLRLTLPEGAEIIPLPPGKSLKMEKLDFIELVDKRATFRNYTDENLSLQELSYLLWGTQGVKSVLAEKPVTKRTVPSAGSRHAFETLMLINKVEGLQPGLYRYEALDHQIARLKAPENIADLLSEACQNQPHVKKSAVTFFWDVVTLRMVWRYRQRGYRFMFLDAGHVCQNLYLLAEAIGCGVCGIAAYEDDLVNAALGLDGVEQFVLYIATLGKRPK